MAYLTRRLFLHRSLALAAAGIFARPYIAKAAATTATVWWAQGFVQDEDVALRKTVADYEKASGNKIDLSIIPFAPERQKIISALTSGVVPDLVDSNPGEILAQYAWKDQWADVTDVVETQQAEYSETALLAAQAYNNVTKKRSFYGVPIRAAVIPIHMWRSLVEKAGYQMSDLPKTWDAFFDFFKEVQKKLRAQGMRRVYGLGFQVTANGVDPNNLFYAFLIAYGGQDIITKDGRPHLDDPQVKEAAIKALSYLTTAYKEGYVPPSAVNWNDADDNNAFHAQLMVMDVDGTLSTEVAIKAEHPDWYYHDIVTQGFPLTNDGKPVPSQVGFTCGLIPKGAKNIAVAKEFLKYCIRPEVVGGFLKTGLGRWLPPMPALAKNDPFWLDPKDPHIPGYVQQGLLGPTMPFYYVFNPAVADIDAEHVWSVAMFDVMNNGMAPAQAIDKAFKRVEELFAKYPIVQG
jgi:multiple sugar transport system substrate-binding protein